MVGAVSGGMAAKAAMRSKQPQMPKQNPKKTSQQLKTDQKPEIDPSKSNSRLKPNYDVEGRIESFDLIPEGEGPFVNQKVYRVFGDGTKYGGKSWTPVDPNSVSDYRAQAGLPNVNTGRFVAEARITKTDGIVIREAAVIYGNGDVHMIKEYVIQDPKSQVALERISGVNPEF